MKDWDDYFIPGTTVLRNVPGITDERELQRFEYEHTGLRHLELSRDPIRGRFDLAHLQAIHKHLFQDVYPWAGELREVSIAKGQSLFALPAVLESFGGQIAREIARDGHLKNLPKPQFVDRLAVHYGELNALHPFREGNGRSTRAFMEQLSREAGYRLSMRGVDPAAWNRAAKASFDRELQPIREIFAGAVIPLRALSFERDTRDRALEQHPELRSVFDELDAARRYAERLIPDAAGQQQLLSHMHGRIAEKLRDGELPVGRLLVAEQGEPSAPSRAAERQQPDTPTRDFEQRR